MPLTFDPATGTYKAEPGETDPLLMPEPLAQRRPLPGESDLAPAPSPLDAWAQGEQAAADAAAQGKPTKLTPNDIGGWIGDPIKAVANVGFGIPTGIADLALMGVDAARWAVGNMPGSEVGNSADNPLTAARIKILTPESETFKAASYMGEIASWFVAPGKAFELVGKVGLGVKVAKGLEVAGEAKDLASVAKGVAASDEAIGGLIGVANRIKEATNASNRFAAAKVSLNLTRTPLANSDRARKILGVFEEASPLMANQMEAALANSARTGLGRTAGFFASNANEFIKAGPGQWTRTFGEVVAKDLFANFMVLGARPLDQDASGISRSLADSSWAPPILSAGARYLVPEYQDAALVAKAKMMVEGSIISAFIQPLMDAARVGLVARKFKFDTMSPEMRQQLLGLLNPERLPDYVGQRMLQAAEDVKGFLPEARSPAVGTAGAPRTGWPGRDPFGALGPGLDDLRAAKGAQEAVTNANKAVNRTMAEQQTFDRANELLQRYRMPEAGAPPAPRFPGEETLPQDRGYGKSFTQGEQAADAGRASRPAWEGGAGEQPPTPGGPEPGWTGGPAMPGGPAPKPEWGSPPARPGEPAPAPAWEPLPTPQAVVSPEGIRKAANADIARFMAKSGNDGALDSENLAAFTEEIGQKVMALVPPSRAGRVDYMKTFLPKVNRLGVMDAVDGVWYNAITRQGLEEGWVRMADDFSSFQFSRSEAQLLDESDDMAKLADSVHQGAEQERLAAQMSARPAAEQTVDVQARPVEQPTVAEPQAPDQAVLPAEQAAVTQEQARINAAGNQLQDTVQAGVDRQPAADMPTQVMGQEPAQPSIADQFQAANDLNLAVDQRAQANTQARLDRMKGMLQELVDNPGAAGTPARAMNERRAKALVSDLEGVTASQGALEGGVDEAAAARALQDEVFEAAPAPVPPKLTDSFEIKLPKISQNEKAMLVEAVGTGDTKVAFGAYSAKGGAQTMADAAEIFEGMTKAEGWTQAEIRTGQSLARKIRVSLAKDADAINAVSEQEGILKETLNAIDGLPNCDFTEML
jgi:hypothetical protein